MDYKKFLFKTLTLLLISVALCFSQTVEKEVKLENYKNVLQKYQNNNEFSKIKDFDDISFKSIVKAVYDAIEIAPTEINNINLKDHYRWVKEIQKDRNYINKNVKSGIVENIILEEVKKRYGYLSYIIVRVPIILKAKVISIKDTLDINGKPKINLILKPEQIIKGKVKFINQKKFTVYYRNWEGVPHDKDYKEGQSYLCFIWDRGEPANPDFAIATWVDEAGNRFLIKSNIIYDDNNKLSMGSQVNWEDFVQKVITKISEITNMKEY